MHGKTGERIQLSPLHNRLPGSKDSCATASKTLCFQHAMFDPDIAPVGRSASRTHEAEGHPWEVAYHIRNLPGGGLSCCQVEPAHAMRDS